MDAICLVAVVADVRRRLLDSVVRGVWAAGPAGLWIELLTSAGPEGLLIAAEPSVPRLSPGVPRPPRTRPLPPLAAVAQRMLPRLRLAAVEHRGLDRVVTLRFAPAHAAGSDGTPSPTGPWLVAELFGRAPNLLLVEPDGRRILELAHHSRPGAARPLAPQAEYHPPPAPSRPDPRLLADRDAVAAVLEPALAAGLPPAQALRQGFYGIGELWAQEVAARARDGSAAALAEALQDLLARIEAGPPRPHLLADEAGTPLAALPIPLAHIGTGRQQPLPTLGEALARLAAHQAARLAAASHRSRLRRVLARLESRLRSRRANLVNDAVEFTQADACQRMGELLVAHQREIPRGVTEVRLPSPPGGGPGHPEEALAIALDPSLSPSANAERYFKRARRARRGSVRVANRLAQTEGELARVHGWAEAAALAEDLQALRRIVQQMQELPRLLGPQERKELAALSADTGGETPGPSPGPGAAGPAARRAQRAAPPGLEPRRFISSDGFPILVGRNTEGNDYLTVHLARSQDWWLHVQGRSGSHVVIRVPDRSGNVPRRTLLEAAQLAAYYSQARDAGKVAVDYTLRKYVRKPRKSKPGLVLISQEKTVFVAADKGLVARLAEAPRPGESHADRGH